MQDIRRKWAKIAPFVLKCGAIFTASAPWGARFSDSGMCNFAQSSNFLTAYQHSCGTLVKMADAPASVARYALVYSERMCLFLVSSFLSRW